MWVLESELTVVLGYQSNIMAPLVSGIGKLSNKWSPGLSISHSRSPGSMEKSSDDISSSQKHSLKVSI